MQKHLPAFVSDGLRRLLDAPIYRQKQAALETKIRQKYLGELSAATNFWQRCSVKEKIQREIKQSKPSPYCLWASR